MRSKGAISVVVLVVLVAAMINAAMNKPKPTPLTDPVGRFSVVFPGSYKQETDSRSNIIMQKFECERPGGKYYWVMYCDYPPQVVQIKGTDAIMNEIAQGTASGCQGQITSMTNVVNSAYYGKEFSMIGHKSIRGEHASGRLFIVNNRVYIVLAAGNGKNFDPDERKFLDTFKIN